MKKTLMALAVGAAFAAPAAHADVTLSGAINMGIEYLDVGGSSAASNTVRTASTTESLSTFGVASNYSNVTITSVDDLGGGLKLDFAFQLVAPTSSNSSVSNRNSHIGLVGESWGGVWYGTNENIYERYFYSIDPLDGSAGLGGNIQIMGNPGAGSVFDACSGNPAANNGCRASWYRRDEQVIWYDSPNFNGFTFGAAIATTYAKTQNTDPWMWQLGVKYVGTSFPLQAWGAYANHKDYFGLADITANQTGLNTGTGAPVGNADSNDRAAQLGVGYTLGDIFLFLNWESLEYKINNQVATGALTNPVVKYSRDAWGVGMKWNLASGYVGAQFIQALEADCDGLTAACNANDTGAQMFGVGYYHTMSKQTQLYTVFSWLGNDDLAAYKTAGIGNAASAGIGATGATGNIGGDYTGFNVGIKHSF
jgi:predicted porin